MQYHTLGIHKTHLQRPATDEGEHLGSARVSVRQIDTARLHLELGVRQALAPVSAAAKYCAATF